MNKLIRFGDLPAGTFFKSPFYGQLALMKDPDTHKALVLVSSKVEGKAYRRDDEVPITQGDLVIPVSKEHILCIFADERPLDCSKRRNPTWQPGQVTAFSRSDKAAPKAFAGLYAYVGLGMGRYHSAKNNELVWCSPEAAQYRAKQERVPLVYFNSLGTVDDPFELRHTASAGMFEEQQAA